MSEYASINTDGYFSLILSITFLFLGIFGKAISYIESNTFQHLQYLAIVLSIVASLNVIIPKLKEIFKSKKKR